MASQGLPWRVVVPSSVLSARINPGSPVFAAVMRHLQEALTAAAGPIQAARIVTTEVVQVLSPSAVMLIHIDRLTVVAALGTLGMLLMLVQRVPR
jgi:hypothetical protein